MARTPPSFAPATGSSSAVSSGCRTARSSTAASPPRPRKAVENLEAQLASVGASLTDVAKTLCFLTDMDTFTTFNEAYVAGFGDHRPARSTIGVAALPAGGAVEIEAWAYKPAGN